MERPKGGQIWRPNANARLLPLSGLWSGYYADSATPYSQLKKYAISFAVVRQKIPHSSADHGMPSV